jgi:hypothetical protein
MPTAKQKKQQARFKKAAAKAKKLYRSGRYNKYSDAMKAALSGIDKSTPSSNYKKRSTPVKVKTKTKVIVSDKSAGVGSMSMGSLLGAVRRKHNDQIDKLVLRKYHATTKREKSKIQKAINAHNAALRKVS